MCGLPVLDLGVLLLCLHGVHARMRLLQFAVELLYIKGMSLSHASRGLLPVITDLFMFGMRLLQLLPACMHLVLQRSLEFTAVDFDRCG